MRKYGSMNMISPGPLVQLLSERVITVCGFCQNLPFSERYTAACRILTTLIIILLKHLSHIKRNVRMQVRDVVKLLLFILSYCTDVRYLVEHIKVSVYSEISITVF